MLYTVQIQVTILDFYHYNICSKYKSNISFFQKYVFLLLQSIIFPTNFYFRNAILFSLFLYYSTFTEQKLKNFIYYFLQQQMNIEISNKQNITKKKFIFSHWYPINPITRSNFFLQSCIQFIEFNKFYKSVQFGYVVGWERRSQKYLFCY